MFTLVIKKGLLTFECVRMLRSYKIIPRNDLYSIPVDGKARPVGGQLR